MDEVRVSRGAVDEITAHAIEALPAECCGMLLGLGSDVVEARRARNLADSPDRFVIDPKSHFDALREARTRGLGVIGFYHSHPHSEPKPSATDLAEATYPDCVHMIIGPLPERATVRLFRYEGLTFVELDFRVRQ